ncbi:MAG TPA: hypothetical protein VIK73_01910 [Limnochordales bacterium]
MSVTSSRPARRPWGKQVGSLVVDALAVAGAGSTLTFALAGWWMPEMSPVRWLSDRGPVVPVATAALLGLLLGLRAARMGRAALQAAIALVLGAAGFALVMAAPAMTGILEAEQHQPLASFVASRLMVSLLFTTPAALIGAMVGAARSGGR